MNNKHPSDMTLPELYLHMKANPGDRETQLLYYKSLADGRLSDYYILSDTIEEMKRAFGIIADIAGEYEDESKYTDDDYIKLLQTRLGRVSVLCARAQREEFPKDD